MHEIPENIVNSSPYGVERWTWWRSGHTGSTEWSKVHLEAITHPTNTSSQRYNKRLITMSLCVSRDTDSLECTVYLPERLKGAKGTGQEETRRKRGLKKRRRKKTHEKRMTQLTLMLQWRNPQTLSKKEHLCTCSHEDTHRWMTAERLAGGGKIQREKLQAWLNSDNSYIT